MRYLLLSDIHGNWEALEAVLADAEGLYDKILCCGDFVGYGPDPNRVVEWAKTSVDVPIRGNHDRICCGLDSPAGFTPLAEAAARWTIQRLHPANAAWLRALPVGPVPFDGFALTHGSPSSEDEYLFSLEEAAAAGPHLTASVTFFGHTHLQGGFDWSGDSFGRIRRGPPNALLSGSGPGVEIKLKPGSRYLVNPGSVGQPRDLDPRAAWAIYRPDLATVRFRRSAYDHEATARKIFDAGLPRQLGHRLALGK
jgi:predicted phosphodiesterase